MAWPHKSTMARSPHIGRRRYSIKTLLWHISWGQRQQSKKWRQRRNCFLVNSRLLKTRLCKQRIFLQNWRTAGKILPRHLLLPRKKHMVKCYTRGILQRMARIKCHQCGKIHPHQKFHGESSPRPKTTRPSIYKKTIKPDDPAQESNNEKHIKYTLHWRN